MHRAHRRRARFLPHGGESGWDGAVYYEDPELTIVYTADVDSVQICADWSALGYRLPTEAEWEYAARGGSAGHRFPWREVESIQHTRANYYSSGTYGYDVSEVHSYHPDYNDGVWPYTSPANSFAPNGFGLYNMAGNVCEWCWDWYDAGYYAASPGSNPRGPDDGDYRVIRGGDWFHDANSCRVAAREWAYPGYNQFTLGFRTVTRQAQ